MEESIDTKYLDNLNVTDSEKYYTKLQKIEGLGKMLERSTDNKIVDLFDELANDIQILNAQNKFLYDTVVKYEKQLKSVNENMKKMTHIIKKHNKMINDSTESVISSRKIDTNNKNNISQ